MDVTVRFEYKSDVLEKAAYYKPLTNQIMGLTRAKIIEYFGFPCGARGKRHQNNRKVLSALGTPTNEHTKIARLFSQRTLLYSVDIIHTFANLGKQNKPVTSP